MSTTDTNGTHTDSTAKALQDKGLDNYTLHGRRRWRGIGLASDDEGEDG